MTFEEARAKLGPASAEMVLPWIGWRGVVMLAELPEFEFPALVAFVAACSEDPPLCVRSETT